jgi:hypothetical protein
MLLGVWNVVASAPQTEARTEGRQVNLIATLSWPLATVVVAFIALVGLLAYLGLAYDHHRGDE